MKDRIEFTRRNLDTDGLTPAEQALQRKVAARDKAVDIRVQEVLRGNPVSNLPKSVNTEKGVTKAEKDSIREEVDTLVDAELNDSIRRGERIRRRLAAATSEGLEFPESSLDEDDNVVLEKVPNSLVYSNRRPDGFLGRRQI